MKFKPIKRRENPSGIYRCGTCGRFLCKNSFWIITKDNTGGTCKRCTKNTRWLWGQNNIQHLRDKAREWSKNNRDKRYQNKIRHRLKKRKAVDPTANRKYILLIYKYARMKTRKTGILHEVDHIIPTTKGGKHHENNLQVLIHTENNIKSNKLDTEIVGTKLEEIKKYYNL